MSNLAIVNQYINNVKHEIYHLVPAKEFLASLQADVEDYVSDFPECGYEDIVGQFGPPEMVARDFIENSNRESPKENARKKKRFKWLFIGLVVVAIICLIYSLVLSSHRQVMFEDVTVESREF